MVGRAASCVLVLQSRDGFLLLRPCRVGAKPGSGFDLGAVISRAGSSNLRSEQVGRGAGHRRKNSQLLVSQSRVSDLAELQSCSELIGFV